ncbi:MAG: LLM class flavin-dependent oxidoreductase [Chloroflexi bacterium]|nr:LLM class flavin-dependent oxidoreductase [Chloroflexota bacterium]
MLPMREWSSPREVYRNTVEQVELAEALGFDAVWLAEHHFSRWGICPNILTFAANLAARTKRVRIGTAVLVLPFLQSADRRRGSRDGRRPVGRPSRLRHRPRLSTPRVRRLRDRSSREPRPLPRGARSDPRDLDQGARHLRG